MDQNKKIAYLDRQLNSLKVYDNIENIPLTEIKQKYFKNESTDSKCMCKSEITKMKLRIGLIHSTNTYIFNKGKNNEISNDINQIHELYGINIFLTIANYLDIKYLV